MKVASPISISLSHMSMVPAWATFRFQLCCVFLATLELNRTYSGAPAEDVHGIILLLVEKVFVSNFSWEPWGCEVAEKKSETGKSLCLC